MVNKKVNEELEINGVVLKPLEEFTDKRGKRVIVKHKRDEFRETATKREVDPEKLKFLEESNAIAEEWVTNMRLSHVLDKLGNPSDIKNIRDVIKAMQEDVFREGEGEIIDTIYSRKAVAKKTGVMYKKRLQLNN